MPRHCCILHTLLDSPLFTETLSKELFPEFCTYLQDTTYVKSQAILKYENPNDIEVYTYLFGGVGTRYLSTVIGEFLCFTPEKTLVNLKWFPVIGKRLPPQTKSLTIIGKTRLSTALLLLLSYYENYLKHHVDFTLTTHFSTPNQLQCLLFMLHNTPDDNLAKIIGKKLTNITLCDNNTLINEFITSTQSHSFTTRNKNICKTFPQHLTIHCTPEINKQTEESKWNELVAEALMDQPWNLSTTSKQSIALSNLFKTTHPSTIEQPGTSTPPPPTTFQSQPQQYPTCFTPMFTPTFITPTSSRISPLKEYETTTGKKRKPTQKNQAETSL